MLEKNNHQNLKKIILWTIGIIIVFIGLFLWSKTISKTIPITTSVTTPKIINNPETLPGVQTGDAPWNSEISHLSDRLNAIGFPLLRKEGTTVHMHQHLDIFIDGKPVLVPSDIGVNQVEGFISDIHTHDTTGIIHIESPKIQALTLGQFFDIWGVDFTSQNIGGYKNQDGKMLKVFVNGSLFEKDLRQLELKSHQEIVVTYGTEKELPSPVPPMYAFPNGY